MIPQEIKTGGRILLKLDRELPPQPAARGVAGKGRCYLCGRARNKTSRKKCVKCLGWVCADHMRQVCERVKSRNKVEDTCPPRAHWSVKASWVPHSPDGEAKVSATP
ncbi:hypothetical protein J6590_076233 [Homalodisca vitripennis]|nr:hypothetical protein J6590_076233 [Homalodisca vitripennis]